VQILAKRRPSVDNELELDDLLDRLFDRRDLTRAGQAEIAAHLQGRRISESKNLDDIRWLYGLMQRVGSFEHAKQVAAQQARDAAATLAGLDWLPSSRHREALAALVDYVHGRTR
jgi:geranylgeranyl diphosphate synthase type II